jgi:hypothetical protein
MKTFEQFIKENTETKINHKTILDEEEENSERTDGSEFERVVDVELTDENN